jgi:hypothetical protein
MIHDLITLDCTCVVFLCTSPDLLVILYQVSQ